MAEARLFLDGKITVWVTEEDIRFWSGFEDAVISGMPKEEILTNVALNKINPNAGDEILIEATNMQVNQDSIDWSTLLHPADENVDVNMAIEDEEGSSRDFRERPPMDSLSSKKQADSNPAQSMAKDCLKIAKELSNLLNSLAALENREEVATAAGLQQLPESIDRLYELADSYRAGGVRPLQPAFAGWEPNKLMKSAGSDYGDAGYCASCGKKTPGSPASTKYKKYECTECVDGEMADRKKHKSDVLDD